MDYRVLAGQMGVLRPPTDLMRVLVVLAPLVGAALVAISRLEDYRHDPYDVLAGSLLGLTVAYTTYRRYFPGLTSSHCGMAYPAKTGNAEKGFGALRDEEERIDSVRDFEDRGSGRREERIPLREMDRDRGTLRTGSGGYG